MFISHSHSDGTHSLPLLRSFSTMSFLGELFLQLIHVQYSVDTINIGMHPSLFT